jgi:hypothetical protein
VPSALGCCRCGGSVTGQQAMAEVFGAQHHAPHYVSRRLSDREARGQADAWLGIQSTSRPSGDNHRLRNESILKAVATQESATILSHASS